MASTPIYREESLERLRAPEELDRLLIVVDRKAWYTLLILAGLCLAALIWAVFGRIPVTVNGLGVMINPGNVKGVQSPAGGQIVDLQVREGQRIRRGQVIAILNQPEIQKELEQQREKRVQLVAFQQTSEQLDAERRALETRAIQDERAFIEGEITKLGELARSLRDQSTAFNERQKQNLEQMRALRERLAKALELRLEKIKQLRREGLSSEEAVLNSETALAESQTRLADLEIQLRQLNLSAIQNDQSYLQQQTRLSELSLQLLQLKIREQRLVQELSANTQSRRSALKDIDDRIEQLELAIEKESQVVSREEGRILEISVAAGQVISSGTRIGTIEIDNPETRLRTVAYFNVADGKRVQPGAAARVTPSTVKRERFGSILGEVTSVSGFPITPEGAVNVVGNNQIAQALLQQGGAIEIDIDLRADPQSYSGYKWTSQGPPVKFSPGTTATVRVIIEERSPISYVLPILRTWVFGQKDDQRPAL